jgi:CheY-like chemotaxis protein
MDVELRNADGVAFLRKTAPSRQAAENEAAVLRLFLDEERRAHRADRGLKPFVLVVEDDPHLRSGMAETLRGSGLRVLGVGRGREGLRLARELTPDLVVLGHRLHDITGDEICRELRAHPVSAGIPIMIVSASPGSISTDPLAGPDVVLARPCGFETILATARVLLRDLAVMPEPGGAPLR